MNKTEWIKKLAADRELWAEDEMIRNGWPAPIVWDVIRLKEQVENGNVYGAILKIRDLYEMSLKIPTLMALVYMDYTDEEKLIEEENIIDALTEEPLSIGRWYNLAGKIIDCAESFSLPECLTNVMERTRNVFDKKVGRYLNIEHWRNEELGHGALKFEDHDDYRTEIPHLLQNYRAYVCGKGSDAAVYQDVCFALENVRLTGDTEMESLPDGKAVLLIDGKTIPLGKYSYGKRFLLESFYSKKNKVKYADFYSGEAEVVTDRDFLSYLRKIKNDNRGVKRSYLRTEDDRMLKDLYRPEKYRKSETLLKGINAFLDRKEGKGLLLLSMERGTGKTAFSNEVDGLRPTTHPLIDNAVIRTYAVSSAVMRGLNDFYAAMNEDFKRLSYTSAETIRSLDAVPPHLTGEEKDPATAMAGLLNHYRNMHHALYGTGRLIFVLDGVDEMTPEVAKMLRYLPASGLLQEGVFVICTSRFADEEGIPEDVRREITALRHLADERLDVRREDPINLEVMKAHVKAWKQSRKNQGENTGSIRAEDLLAGADYRMLYLKAYLPLVEIMKAPVHSTTAIFDFYLSHIQSMHDQASAIKMLRFLMTVAVYGSISLDDYFNLIAPEELTYRFIGRLNDLMPLLSAHNTEGGRTYAMANETYRSRMLEAHHEELLPQLIREFQASFSAWFTETGTTTLEFDAEQLRICDFWIRNTEMFQKYAKTYHLEAVFYQQGFVEDVVQFQLHFEVNYEGFRTDELGSMYDCLKELAKEMWLSAFLNDGFGSNTPMKTPTHLFELSDYDSWDMEWEDHQRISRHLADLIREGRDISPWRSEIFLSDFSIELYSSIYRHGEREFWNGRWDKTGWHIGKMISAFFESGREKELLKTIADIEPKEAAPGIRIVKRLHILYLEEMLRYPDLPADLKTAVQNTLKEQLGIVEEWRQMREPKENWFALFEWMLAYEDDPYAHIPGAVPLSAEEREARKERQREPYRLRDALTERLGTPKEERLQEWFLAAKEPGACPEEIFECFRFLMQAFSQQQIRTAILAEYVYCHDTAGFFALKHEKDVPDALRELILPTDNAIDLIRVYHEAGDAQTVHKLCMDVCTGLQRQEQTDAESLDYCRILAFENVCKDAGEDFVTLVTTPMIQKWMDAETTDALCELEKTNRYTSTIPAEERIGRVIGALFLNRRFEEIRTVVLPRLHRKLDYLTETSEESLRKMFYNLQERLCSVESLIEYEISHTLPAFCRYQFFFEAPIHQLYSDEAGYDVFDDVSEFEDALWYDGLYKENGEPNDEAVDKYLSEKSEEECEEDLYEDGMEEDNEDDIEEDGITVPDDTDDDFVKMLDDSFASQGRKQFLEETYCRYERDPKVSILCSADEYRL
ncbi:MAG: hypothetical protein IK016_06255 [Lachnospiraceae bacterium]|nr:hypothetical protein [Lachnospiraceae bacterium]